MSKLISLLEKIQDVKVIDASIDYSDYVAIDLSTANKKLDDFDLSNAEKFQDFIENFLLINNAKVAFGGYNEIRNILGINQESVRTHKYRLKKKMALSKSQDLSHYLKSVTNLN